MRAAIFRNGQIVVDTLPEPKPAAGQVLVKSLACGICGSDLHARQHAHRMVELSKHFPTRKAMDLSLVIWVQGSVGAVPALSTTKVDIVLPHLRKVAKSQITAAWRVKLQAFQVVRENFFRYVFTVI